MIYTTDQEGYVAQDFYDLLSGLVNDTRDSYKHPCYVEACQHAEEMAVHLYGKKPEKLLNMVRPREDEEIKKYRLDAYQPTTKSTADKALAIVSKIFNPTLYTISWKDQTNSGKELQSYTLEYYPVFNSVVTFLQQTALKKVISDPNGVMVIRPMDMMVPDSVRVKPIAKIYGSASVWYFDTDMFLIFRKMVSPQKGGDLYYFEYYDKNVIRDFVVERVAGNKINITVQAEYVHNFGEVPAWHLRGVPESKDNGEVIYKSFFEAAVPFWNLAISHESDLFGAYINHLHPIRTELSEECDFVENMTGCKGGWLRFGDGSSKICPGCNGTGHKSVKSPYGVYKINADKLGGENRAGLTPVEYITVPTEPTKMLEERVDKLLEKGLYALNMDILNKVGENQSGVAKVIDRDELYDFLYRISTVMFDVHLTNIYYFFNKFMFGLSDLNPNRDMDKNLPEISKPVQFDISSALELMEEMKAAKEAGVNPQYMRESQKMINDKKFASSPDIKNRLDLMIDLDPCPELDVDNLTVLLDKGLIPKENAVIHHNIEILVDKALFEKKGFANMPKDKQMEILKEYAEEMMEEMEEKIDKSAIDETEEGSGNPGFNGRQGNEQSGDPDSEGAEADTGEDNPVDKGTGN